MSNQTNNDIDLVRYVFEDGILVATYKSGISISLPIAREIVGRRIQFCNGKNYPGLVINNDKVVSIDREARNFFASEEGIKGLTAVAMVLNSVFANFLGNFLLKVSPTKIPVRIFNDKEKAIKWLSSYKI